MTELKTISQDHWQNIFNKLLNNGMTSDNAYEWMRNKFYVDDFKYIDEN